MLWQMNMINFNSSQDFFIFGVNFIQTSNVHVCGEKDLLGLFQAKHFSSDSTHLLDHFLINYEVIFYFTLTPIIMTPIITLTPIIIL